MCLFMVLERTQELMCRSFEVGLATTTTCNETTEAENSH